MFTGLCPIVKLCSDLRKAGPKFLADHLTLNWQAPSAAELLQRDPKFLVYSPPEKTLHKSMSRGLQLIVFTFAKN